jgi:dihydrodipicolinate synthase/N-acetylneuraminate lyase
MQSTQQSRQCGPGALCGPDQAFEKSDLPKVVELDRRVLSLLPLGEYSDPPIGAIKLAMKKLGTPISPTVRGHALPAAPEAEEAVEAVLRETRLSPVTWEA